MKSLTFLIIFYLTLFSANTLASHYLLNEDFSNLGNVTLRPLGGSDTFTESKEWFFLFSNAGVFSYGSGGMSLSQNPLTPSALGIEIKNGFVRDETFVIRDGFYYNLALELAVRTYNASLFPSAWAGGVEDAEGDPRLVRWSIFLNDFSSAFSLAVYITNEMVYLVYDKADIANPTTGCLVNYLIPVARWNLNAPGNFTNLENVFRQLNLLFDSDGRVIVMLDNLEVYRGRIPQDRDLDVRYLAVDNGVAVTALGESMTLSQFHIVITMETEPNMHLPGYKSGNTPCNSKALRRATSWLVGNFPAKNPCPLTNGTLAPSDYWDSTPNYSDEYGQGISYKIRSLTIQEQHGVLY